MVFRDEFEQGKKRADEDLAEARRAIDKHEEALEIERIKVLEFYSDLQATLPMTDLEAMSICCEVPTPGQLMFLHRSGNDAESSLQTIATLSFDARTLQFFYADFMSNFERKLPLPPNTHSFSVIAGYLGGSIRWWFLPEEDRKLWHKFRGGLRETLGGAE